MDYSPWLLFAGVVVTAVLSWLGARMTMKSSDRANERSTGVEALTSANATLFQLLDPVKRELKETTERLAATTARVETLEQTLDETQAILSDSLTLNLSYMEWIEKGAHPPPPTAATNRLKKRLNLSE